jgi:transcriptional regulator with XRE-family HTH domain
MKWPVTANRLKQAMNKINISAQELADKSGVSKASISQYVNGSHKPSNISAPKLAKVLMVNAMWLMGFDIDDENKQPSYYMDPETAKKAQEIFENKELSLLFDAARDASPEDIQTVHTMLLALKKKEKGE